jgi:hypothetical protein
LQRARSSEYGREIKDRLGLAALERPWAIGRRSWVIRARHGEVFHAATHLLIQVKATLEAEANMPGLVCADRGDMHVTDQAGS